MPFLCFTKLGLDIYSMLVFYVLCMALNAILRFVHVTCTVVMQDIR